jgi:hypothetical protein
MSAAPEALDHGFVLRGRFGIDHPIGRGGFGITYAASDLDRKDLCVVKELAPEGAVRLPDGRLDLRPLGAATAQRLRHQFVHEAQVLGRLHLRGIIPVRTAWQENGTAYIAMDYVHGAMPLQKVLLSEGRMDVEAVLDIVYQLLEALEAIHARGLLHRDLKPSNVLLGPKGEAYLIDFGSAREWHADRSAHHTVEYTPGYAPIEQMSETGRRGPGTDLYGLCALAYALLPGSPPTPAVDRIGGAPLIPLRSVRPDVEPAVAAAIEAGLQLDLDRRPATAAELRSLLDSPPSAHEESSRLKDLDERLVRLQHFRFGVRECPACGDVLDQPQPLRIKRGGLPCPVCREGIVRRRTMSEAACPICRVGVLQRVANLDPLRLCPTCKVGLLRKRGLGLRNRTLVCRECGEVYSGDDGKWTRASDNLTLTSDEWRAESGRSVDVRICDTCAAQFDRLPDDRMRQVLPAPKPDDLNDLFVDEWARIAAGLDPGAGNAVCDACEADYFLDGDRVTLLSATLDPFGFAATYLGRLLRCEALPWLAVGKSSGQEGLVCAECGTEFDGLGDGLVLVKSKHALLRTHLGEKLTLENWHRLAKDLPLAGQEETLVEEMTTALREAYVSGELPFDSRDPDILWRGPASRVEGTGDQRSPRGSGQLVLDADGLTFGGIVRKLRLGRAALRSARVVDGILRFEIEDGSTLDFEVEPVVFSVKMESGRWETLLDGSALAERFNGAA